MLNECGSRVSRLKCIHTRKRGSAKAILFDCNLNCSEVSTLNCPTPTLWKILLFPCRRNSIAPTAHFMSDVMGPEMCEHCSIASFTRGNEEHELLASSLRLY